MNAVPSVMESAVREAPMAEKVMGQAADEGARATIEKAPDVVMNVVSSAPNYALWFFLGCLFVILLLIGFELVKAKRDGK